MYNIYGIFPRVTQVLSVVAQHISSIQAALRAKAADVIIASRTVRLTQSCGIFVTMNPGYSGRTELPQNLQALFRPMAVMVPDYAAVAEVTLFWCALVCLPRSSFISRWKQSVGEG
jgi:hypothetical protein